MNCEGRARNWFESIRGTIEEGYGDFVVVMATAVLDAVNLRVSLVEGARQLAADVVRSVDDVGGDIEHVETRPVKLHQRHGTPKLDRREGSLVDVCKAEDSSCRGVQQSLGEHRVFGEPEVAHLVFASWIIEAITRRVARGRTEEQSVQVGAMNAIPLLASWMFDGGQRTLRKMVVIDHDNLIQEPKLLVMRSAASRRPDFNASRIELPPSPG